MTFDRLEASFRMTRVPPGGAGAWPFAQDDLSEVFSSLGGVCLDDGLYRVHSPESAERWSRLITGGFPSFQGRALCFGYDWLGRQFAVDRDRVGRTGNLCLLFEPGSGRVLEIPMTPVELHEDGLVDLAEAALAAEFYRAWRRESGDRMSLGEAECVGYRLPLFLGGADEVSNLERTDMAVYWALVGQMWIRVADKESGTAVTEVRRAKRRFLRS